MSKEVKITTLLKYFDLKHDFISLISKKDVNKTISISEFGLIQVFFKEVVDYFYKNLNNIPKLDYSDNKISSHEKFNIIKNYTPNSLNSPNSPKGNFDINIIKIYDLIDCMFYITRKFLEYCKFNETFKLEYLFNDLDLLFYILFYKYFPNELNVKLIDKLKITETDYNIIEKCNNILIKSSVSYSNTNIFSICKYHEPNLAVTYESLHKKGVILLFKMIMDFRRAGTRPFYEN